MTTKTRKEGKSNNSCGTGLESYTIHGDGVPQVNPERLLKSERFKTNWSAAKNISKLPIPKQKQ